MWDEPTIDGLGADGAPSLGERIALAARLAVAVHLFESLRSASPDYGRSFTIGGAGPVAAGGRARSALPPVDSLPDDAETSR